MFTIIGAFIITIFAGYFGAGILGNLLNWPDAGAVCAIATMGAFILSACLKDYKTQNDNSSNSENQNEENK